MPSLQPLIAADVVRRFGPRTVLNGVTLTVAPGHRLGLVGENGSGKSTLIRILAGVDEPDGGSVSRPDDLGYLAQQPDFPRGATVSSVLAASLAEYHACLAALDDLGRQMAEHLDDAHLAARYADRLAWAETHEAWDADRRAVETAAALGLTYAGDREVATMSGGEQIRLALAGLMARRPSCVIMDEPTNHLDEDALTLLEDFLRELPGPVLVASHDRVFLDRVCTHLVDTDPNPIGVDGEGGNTFTGAFSDYLAAKQAARERWQQTYEAQQEQLKGLRRAVKEGARAVGHGPKPPRDADKFVRYFKDQQVDATVSRRVRDAQRRVEEAEADQVRKPRPGLTFALPELAGTSSGMPVSARDLVLRGRIRIPHLDVAAGDHVLITGPNGCGKSSFLLAVAGQLTPTSGTLHRPRTCGFLPQDVEFDDPARSAVETYAAAGLDPEGVVGLGLLHSRDLSKAVGTLSVGQRRRLALAMIVGSSPAVLLLDEPTNHISLLLATELEEALGATPATVIVASHDRWLRRRWQGRTYAMDAPV